MFVMNSLFSLLLTKALASEICRVLYVAKPGTPKIELAMVQDTLALNQPTCTVQRTLVEHLGDVSAGGSAFDLIIAHDFGFGDLGLAGELPAGLRGQLTREGRLILLAPEPVRFDDGTAWRAQASRTLASLGADHGSIFVPLTEVNLAPTRRYYSQIPLGDPMLFGAVAALAAAANLIAPSATFEFRAMVYVTGAFALLKLSEFVIGDRLTRSARRRVSGGWLSTLTLSYVLGPLAAAFEQGTLVQSATALGSGVLIGSAIHFWQTAKATGGARAWVAEETKAGRLNKGRLAYALGRGEITSIEDEFSRVLRCEGALDAIHEPPR